MSSNPDGADDHNLSHYSLFSCPVFDSSTRSIKVDCHRRGSGMVFYDGPHDRILRQTSQLVRLTAALALRPVETFHGWAAYHQWPADLSRPIYGPLASPTVYFQETGPAVCAVTPAFTVFILACGSTHFLDAMAFRVPLYRLNALLRFPC